MDNYDILEHYVKQFSDSYYIRPFSDNTVNVSAYIDKKHISLQGANDIVLECVKHLCKENRE